jgi:hypothetical protein
MSHVAARTYRQLRHDPRRTRLLVAVDRVLDLLDADPTAPALSPRVFASPLWGTQVRAVEVLWAGDPWLIVWRIRPDGSPSVAYLGPAPARI